MKTLGMHTLIDYYDCDPQILRDPAQIREILLDAVRRSGLHIVMHTFHHFAPHGVSGVVVIAESHVTIHTWPEHCYAAVDLFTCGAKMRSDLLQSLIQAGLGSTRSTQALFPRGNIPGPVFIADNPDENLSVLNQHVHGSGK